MVASLASEEEGSSTSQHAPNSSSQESRKQHGKQAGAGAHTKSKAKEVGSAARGKGRGSSAQQQAAHGKQKQRTGNEKYSTGGSVTKGSTDEEGGVPARTKGSVPQQTSKRQWQGQRGEQGFDGMLSTIMVSFHPRISSSLDVRWRLSWDVRCD